MSRYRKVVCQYCNNKAEVVKGDILYGLKHKLKDAEFYACTPCGAWVGMHKDSKKPFGSLANSVLRKRRLFTHDVFDKLWKNTGDKSMRKQAYSWLAKELNIPDSECHIGMFDLDMCNKVIRLAKLELLKRQQI